MLQNSAPLRYKSINLYGGRSSNENENYTLLEVMCQCSHGENLILFLFFGLLWLLVE